MVQIGSLSVFSLIFSCRTLPRLGRQTVLGCHLLPKSAYLLPLRRHEARRFKADALGFSVQASRLGAIDLGSDGHAMG